ncbi:O-antigen ligase family protein [Bowmanella denitrificans]|uniref:O-antigen ligase family protein n=1 Tax=Bowmanella denitrificans TaxID=366582 RepID=UPI000C9D1225|nr:O-antigen ligase family protein [Bowmanella denitrificans]
MAVHIDSLKRLCLLLTLIYYCGLLDFATRLVSGRATDVLAAHAAGDPARQFVGVLLLLLAIFLLCYERDNRVSTSFNKDLIWWALLGYLMLSVLWSYVPAITLRRVVAFSTLVLSAYVLVQSFSPLSLLRFFARAVGIITLLGLLLVPLLPELVLVGGGIRDQAFVGLFADKNAGARNCAYAFLLLFGLVSTKTGLDKGLMLILLVAIAFANSATAWVMLLAGIGLITLLRYLHATSAQTSFNRLMLFAVLLILGCLLCYWLYEQLLGLLGRDPTLTNRMVIWQLMDGFIDIEPYWGYGFGAFWASDAADAFVSRWGYIGNAHSGYYEAMLHGGWACLLLVVALMATGLWHAGNAYIRLSQGQSMAAPLAILLLMIPINAVAFAVLNHNSFDMFLFALMCFTASRLAAEAQPDNWRVV